VKTETTEKTAAERPLDLDILTARAEAADQETYQAKKVDCGEWDHVKDQPLEVWWVERGDWIDCDDTGLFYTEADARYAETMHPQTTLRLIAKLRAAQEAVEAARHHLLPDQVGPGVTVSALEVRERIAAYDKVV
jgi:hypothetical protein